MTRSNSLTLLLLLASGLVCQTPSETASRKAHPGRVVNASGAPIAGADVTFLSAGAGNWASADVVHAVARDNGRFRVRLLPGRQYQAFAVAPAGTLLTDAPTVSALSDRGAAMTEIQFGGKRLFPARKYIEVGALEPWWAHGEVKIEAWLAGCPQDLGDPIVAPGTDRVRIPPLPDEDLEIVVYVDGKMVHVQDRVTEFDMPPPFVVRGRVATADGQLIAGARIHRLRNWLRKGGSIAPLQDGVQRHLVATTGEDGTAEWLVAAPKDPFVEKLFGQSAMTFVAAADGFRGGVAGFTRGVISNRKLITAEVRDRTLPFVLEAQPPLELSVGTGVQATGVSWTAAYAMPLMEFSFTTSYDARVDIDLVDGKAVLPMWPRVATTPRLYLRGVAPRLESDDPFRSAVVPRLLEVTRPNLTKPLHIDASQIVPVRVQLLAAEGNPASAVDVYCVSLENGVKAPFVWPAATDTAGRVVLSVMPGRYLLIAIDDRDWIQRELEIAPKMPPLALKLEPMPCMRLRVLDADGEPVSGASASWRSESQNSTKGALQNLLQDFGSSYARRSISRRQSDQNGHITVPLITANGLSVSFIMQSGRRSSSEITLVENEDRIDVVLRK